MANKGPRLITEGGAYDHGKQPWFVKRVAKNRSKRKAQKLARRKNRG